MIYMDHAATSPPRKEALEAMWPYMTNVFANPSSTHELGRQAKAGLDNARAVVASVFNCRPGEVVFTSGGTESNNLAIQGISLAQPRGRHIVISAVEHKAVYETAMFMRDRHGFEVDVVPVDSTGVVHMDQLAALLRDDTTLCSVMYANNEMGTIQPTNEIAALCSARGVPFHVDAVQAAGLLSIDTAALGVQAMSISAHKFGGPRGTGALFVAGVLGLEPVQHGGGQERGRRSGTSDVAGAVGLATALKLAESERLQHVERLIPMRDQLIEGVLDTIPVASLTGHRTRRLANSASFCFQGVNGEAVLQALEQLGVICSSGSACSSESEEASAVLSAMGIDEALVRTAVRFTLGATTTLGDIEAVVSAVPRAIESVKALD